MLNASIGLYFCGFLEVTIRENAEHQSKVADSASAMEGVANSSIGQVQSIQGAIKRHKELVSMMKMTYN